jgi:hypothetical protein
MSRFNASAYWEALSPIQQRRIGEAALLVMNSIAAECLGDQIPELTRRRWRHARDVAFLTLQSLLPTTVATLAEGPDLAALGIRACRVCGCTLESACDGGCYWVGPDLCSRCGPTESANNNSFEFDCAECGRQIVQFVPLTGDRCAACLNMPGWFRDPELRRALEPDPDWVPPNG